MGRVRRLTSGLAWVASWAFLAVVFLAPSEAARRWNGVTFDETFFLGLGLQAWLGGDLSAFVPDYAAPLPVLLAYGPAALSAAGRTRFEATAQPATVEALYRGRVEDPPLVSRARLVNASLLGLPLVLLVQVWLARHVGHARATLAAAFLALSPSLVGQASLATTDVGFVLFAVLLLLALARHRDRGTWGTATLAGAALGLAVAAKLSALAFLPLAAWHLWWTGRPWPQAARQTAAGLALAGLVAWGVWGFGWATTSAGWELPAPAAAWAALRDAAGHRDQFLLGQRSQTGWPYYFAATFLLKSTTAELIVGLLALAAAGSVFSPRGGSRPDERLWLAAIACVLAASAMAPLNIGHRHVLVLYPLLVLLVASWGTSRLRPRPATVVALALLALQAVPCLTSPRNAMAYFNPVFARAADRRLLLVDSNLDWGQDLPRLQAAARGLGCRHIALFYFGTAAPEAYGLVADEASRPECAAISATLLQGVYVPDDRFRVFRALPEAGRAGDSILLYRSADPGVTRALELARSASVRLQAETSTGLYRVGD